MIEPFCPESKYIRLVLSGMIAAKSSSDSVDSIEDEDSKYSICQV